MDIGSFLNDLCLRIQDIFRKSYGDPANSKSGDIVLPAAADWVQVAVMGSPCILTLRNSDATNELQYTWNQNEAIGSRLAAGERVVYEAVSGTLYAKTSDSSGTSTLNISMISLRET